MAAPTTVRGNIAESTSKNVLSVGAPAGPLTVVWIFARAAALSQGEKGTARVEWRVSASCAMRAAAGDFGDASAANFALRAHRADPKRPHEIIVPCIGAQTSIVAVAWLPSVPLIGSVDFTWRAIQQDPDHVLDVWGFADSLVHQNCGLYLLPFHP